LEENSSGCIMDNTLMILEHPNIECIIKKAHTLVEKRYNYETAVERYKEIIGQI
jgi:hypothetical protein